jgi:hypothetical protein
VVTAVKAAFPSIRLLVARSPALSAHAHEWVSSAVLVQNEAALASWRQMRERRQTSAHHSVAVLGAVEVA